MDKPDDFSALLKIPQIKACAPFPFKARTGARLNLDFS